MAKVYLVVDDVTSVIENASYYMLAASAGQTLVIVDSSLTNAIATTQNPQSYLYQSGSITERPYFELAYSEGSITATLQGAPVPNEVTFTVLGQALSATPVTTNGVTTAKINIAVHPCVDAYSVPVDVSASGFVNGQISLGGTDTTSPVSLQLYTPTGGTPIIGPSKLSAMQFLQSYYTINSTTIQALLTNIGTGLSILYDTVFNVLLPAAQKATYTPVALDANQTNAVSALEAGLASSLFTTLENGFPSGGGTEQMQFGAFIQNFQRGAANVQGFMEALQTFGL